MIPQIEQDTQDSIYYFSRRFWELGYFDGHFVFACHAAVPIALTADLLYQLWANFQDYTSPNGIPSKIDAIAVSDLLMANFCRNVGQDVFEMDIKTRAYLLNCLQSDTRFGVKRMQEIACFLQQYIEVQPVDDSMITYREAQLWAAKVIIQPMEAAVEIANSLSIFVRNSNESEIFRMRLLLESYTNQNASFNGLLHFSKGLKAHLLDLGNEVIQEQFDQAKAFTQSHGFSSNKFTLSIPVFDQLKEKVIVPTEEYLEIMSRIEQARIEKENKLNLSGLSLRELPEALFELTHLTELDISNNRIAELPQKLTVFTHLQTINVSQNPIRIIPDWFRQLRELRTLKIDNAEIKNLSDSIFRLKKLQELSLKNNNIDFLPEEITNLPFLMSINLSGNPIANLPDDNLDCTANQLKIYFNDIQVSKGISPVIISSRNTEFSNINLIEDIFYASSVQSLILNNPSLVDLYRNLKTHRNQAVIIDYPDMISSSYQKQKGSSSLAKEIPIQFFSQLQNLKFIFLGMVASNRPLSIFLEQLKIGVIATSETISEDKQVQFSISFYRALKQGSSLIEALDLANSDIHQEKITPERLTLDKGYPFCLYLPVIISLEDLNRTLLTYIADSDINGYFNVLYHHVSRNFQRTLMGNIQNEYLELQEKLERGEIQYQDFANLNDKNIIALTDSISQIKQEDLIGAQLNEWRLVTKQDLSQSLANPIARLPVSLVGDKSDQDFFLKLYHSLKPSIYLRLHPDSGNVSSFQLYVQKDRMTIEDTKENKLIHGIYKINLETIIYIIEKLEQIEKWQRIFSLQNRFSGLNDELIKIRFETNIDGQHELHESNTINLIYAGREIPFECIVENQSKQQIFASLLYLTENYGIELITENVAIEPGRALNLLKDSLFIPERKYNNLAVTDIFKIIVCTSQFRLAKYEEVGINPVLIKDDVALLSRDKKAFRSIDFSLDSDSSDQDWITKTVKIITSLSDELVWNIVKENNTPTLLNRYLQLFPYGKFITEANTLLTQLTRQKIEYQASFENVSLSGNSDLNYIKQEIRDLIGQAKIKEALSILLEKSNDKSDVALLKSRYSRLNRDSTLGLISSGEYSVEQNKIVYSILNLVDKLTDSHLQISSFDSLTQVQNLDINIKIYMATGEIRLVNSIQELEDALNEYYNDLVLHDYKSLSNFSHTIDDIIEWAISLNIQETNAQAFKELRKLKGLIIDLMLRMEHKNFDGFGKIMNESKRSMRLFVTLLSKLNI